jgi:hypothetical protein
MINLRFVNVVWGEEFTDTFVNICLPSTLSAGNLKFVAAHSRSIYRIYTTPKDAETIARSRAGQQLAKLMPLEISRVDAALPVEGPDATSVCQQKYSAMALCHEHFIKAVSHEGLPMVILSPDLFCADGSLRRLLEIAQSGKRVVMMSALRLAKESFLAALHEHHMKGGALRPIGKRDLVSLAMNHLHPETESIMWESGQSNVWPSLLLWKVPQEGLILRAFHLHPLLLRPVQNEVLPTGTLDDDYVARACPDPADQYIVQDSDEMVAFELSRRSARAEFVAPVSQTPTNVAQWARAHANPRHQKFFQNRICLHSGAFSETWQATQERSDRAVQEIQSLLAPKLDAVPS